MSVLLGDGESKRKWGNRFISLGDHSSWLPTTCLLLYCHQLSTTTSCQRIGKLIHLHILCSFDHVKLMSWGCCPKSDNNYVSKHRVINTGAHIYSLTHGTSLNTHFTHIRRNIFSDWEFSMWNFSSVKIIIVPNLHSNYTETQIIVWTIRKLNISKSYSHNFKFQILKNKTNNYFIL